MVDICYDRGFHPVAAAMAQNVPPAKDARTLGHGIFNLRFYDLRLTLEDKRPDMTFIDI